MSGTCAGATAFLCSPNGPGTPFGGPVMAVWDTARAATILAALAVVVVTPRVAAAAATRWQALRFYAVALFAVVAATSLR